ncbi:MAG: glycoside hydrolase family 2 TIM barrel-domain containing protein [bacterium]|nr:glycoside hydrolase family 2 TIM barrel-domain containing protein [bacterium]
MSTKRTSLLALTLVLAALVCPAEGLVYYEQREVAQPPTPALQAESHQVVVNLQGGWEMRAGDRAAPQSAFLPGCFEHEKKPLIFRRTFNLADSLKSLHFQLHLPEISYTCDVRINGRLTASLTGFHLGFVCDLAPDQLRFGAANEIELRIGGRLTPRTTFPVRRQIPQARDYVGCFGGVYLRGVPSWSIEDARLASSLAMDSTSEKPVVLVRVAQYGPINVPADNTGGQPSVLILAALHDSSDQIIASGQSDVLKHGRENDYRAVVSLPAIRAVPWSPARPYCYRLTATLMVGADTLHQFSRIVGFKTVEIRDDKLYLNGTPLGIRGMDYVPDHPLGRRAVSSERLRQDLTMIRDLGMNVVRVPFDPPPPGLLEAADTLGLLVLAETAIGMIPSPVLESAEYRALVSQAVIHEIETLRDHPSLLAWGVGSQLDWNEGSTREFSQWIREVVKQSDDHPCYVETHDASVAAGSADFVLQTWDSEPAPSNPVWNHVPVIFSGVQQSALLPCDGDPASSGLVNQTEFLIRSLRAIEGYPDADGFLIHALFDYYGCSPLVTQPTADDPSLYAFGLMDWNRHERLVYAKLRDLVQTGQVSLPVPIRSSAAPPLAFPIMGLAALFVLSIELRRNNVFRQNLKRTFLHPHGFSSDLRNRRFLHTSQPFFLWLLESVVLGLLLGSVLYSLRGNPALDYYLAHFVPFREVKTWIIHLIWDPVRLLGYSTALMAALILLKVVLIRLVSALFGNRVDIRQAWNYVIWSLAALLFLLPVAVVFYRALQIPTVSRAAVALLIAGILWVGVRFMNALWTGFATTRFKVYLILFGTMALLFIALLAVLENQLGTITYLDYYHSVFLSGH